MLACLQAFMLLVSLQEAVNPKVNRIFVTSPYNNSIVFEYARASMPEDQALTDESVHCFTTELKSTGLFEDVRILLKPIQKGQRVNINVEPIWNLRADFFVIDEISLEGFTGIHEGMLRENLRFMGLQAGTPLRRYPFPQIKSIVQEAASKIYQSEPKTKDEVEERLSELSLRIKLTAPERVRLIIAVGHKNICQ